MNIITKDLPSCNVCGYDINKYFGSVLIRMCRNCRVLYCKTCSSKSLKGGKCLICKKPTEKIKKPKENPFYTTKAEPQRERSAKKPKENPFYSTNVVPQKETKTKKLSKRELREQGELEIKKKYSGDFKQSGVLCIACKTVTPFRNKKCINCRRKLRITPQTTVYFNGNVQAIQCRKCGEYTDVKGLVCEHCGKKLKV